MTVSDGLRVVGLKREPRLQKAMLRGWQHLMRGSPGHHLYCDVPLDWILRATKNECDRSLASPQRLRQVDFVLCTRADVPLVAVHLIDGPGLNHRRDPQEVRRVRHALSAVSSAGLRVWTWDAHALPPLDVLRRHVRRLSLSIDAATAGRFGHRESQAGAADEGGWCGWLETRFNRLRSLLSHRFAQPPAEPARSDAGRLAPILYGLDEAALRSMGRALGRLLDKVPNARKVFRHAGALEWGLKRLGAQAFLALPLSVLAGASVQLGELGAARAESRAIHALRARLQSATALRRALLMAEEEVEWAGASGVISIDVQEVGMSTFVEVDRTWHGEPTRRGRVTTAAPTVRASHRPVPG